MATHVDVVRCEYLPLDRFQLAAYNLMQQCHPKVWQCARHSLIGINKAWGLKDIDKEMSIFRAITAEEEMATGVINALQVRGYDGASLMVAKSHPHKAAIFPFVQVILSAFHCLKGHVDLKLSIEVPEGEQLNRPRLRIIPLKPTINQWLYPEPPLNFSCSITATTIKVFVISKFSSLNI